MSKSHLHAGVALVLVSLSLGQGAKAQMDGSYPNMAPSTMDTYMSSHIGNLSLGNVVKGNQKGGRVRGTSKAAPKARPSAARPVALTYRATPAVTQKVINQYVAWARTQSPQEAATLKTTFARHNPVQVWSQIVKEDGLKTGDVGDSLTAYWILNYMLANQIPQSTRAQALAVRDQIRPLLASSPLIAGLTQAQRQEISEVWMVNYLVQQGAYGTAMKRQDKSLMKRLSDAANIRFQSELGVNLRQLKLTNQGFVART